MKIILISLLVFSFMARTGAVAQTRGTEWETVNDEVKSMYRQGQYGRAEVLAKKALQTAEQTLGLDHPGVAASLNNLAALYFTQGQYEQAEPLYKRSLAISEKAIGPNHSDVATVLENMAILYRKTDRVKTADEFEKRAASIRNISIKIKQEEDGKYLPEDNVPDPYSMTSPAPITMALTTDQVSISAPAVDKTVAKPAILIGDSYTFEVQNPADPQLNYVINREITDIDSNRLTVVTTNMKNGNKRITYYEHDWGYLGSGSGENDGVSFSPALKYFDFPLSVGKKWTAQSIETDKKTGRQRHHTISGTVEGWEKIHVPAGDFEALKIVLRTEVKQDGIESPPGTDISWYVPSLRRSVKSELTGLDLSTGREEKKIIHLISYHVQ